MSLPTNLRVAVVHNGFLEHGGGEVVAAELARALDAPLYCGYGDPDALPDDVDVRILFTDWKSRLFSRSMYIRDLWNVWRWQSVPELYEYDVLIQSGNDAGWYVPRDDQLILKYVHSPPRTPYDQFHHAASSPIKRLYAFVTRTLYAQTLPYTELFLANSELVARRINLYWGIERDQIRVLYPPVDVDSYYSAEPEEFYFTFSRLYPQKRIDEIIEAFNGTEQRLIVGGDGPEKEHLEAIAHDNIEFIGFMSEEEKRDYLSRARALIFNAQNEDFGLVPIEAFASGTPVLGVREGFTQYQVREGLNGYTYERGVEQLVAMVERFESDGVDWTGDEIREAAYQYGLERFERELETAVEDAISRRDDWFEETPGESV
jgi:glycosyltransferase involved in cell wall biosynthesis